MSDIKTEPTPDEAREAKREQLERAGEKNLDVNPRNGQEGLERKDDRATEIPAERDPKLNH